MKFEILPTRASGAAEAMATDFLLLRRYPESAVARFRHYGWHRPAWTFGYSQKIDWVRAQLPADHSGELCRRPTGGGIVDHREDWTYALVVPRGHPLEEQRATQSYREVHEQLTTALRAHGCDAVLKPCEPASLPDDTTTLPAGICFQRAEIFDVVNASTGEKIAGAAQKRTKHGLLFQGSIWRPAAGASVDWQAFGETFVQGLGQAVTAEPVISPWPEFNEDELSALIEQYASPEWLELR